MKDSRGSGCALPRALLASPPPPSCGWFPSPEGAVLPNPISSILRQTSRTEFENRNITATPATISPIPASAGQSSRCP